jgi:hypothetical protein
MKKTVAGLFGGLVMVMLFTAVASADGIYAPWIHQREGYQHERIDQGIHSGQLTPGESRHLRAEQAKIRHDERLFKSDGILTRHERAILTAEQNHANREIYRMKHNRWRSH